MTAEHKSPFTVLETNSHDGGDQIIDANGVVVECEWLCDRLNAAPLSASDPTRDSLRLEIIAGKLHPRMSDDAKILREIAGRLNASTRRADLTEEEKCAVEFALSLTDAPDDDQDPEGIVPGLLAIIERLTQKEPTDG